MRGMKAVLSSAVALALGVCVSLSATAAPPAKATYQAAPGLDTSGWLTANADDGRYTVVYTGTPGMKREQVAEFALLRAAEFTSEAGLEWFAVTRKTSRTVPIDPRKGDLSSKTGGSLGGNPTAGTGSGAAGGSATPGASNPTTRGGPSTGGFGGGDVPYQVLERWQPVKVPQTILEIQMGSGDQAQFKGLKKAPEIFDAKKVSSEIRAKIQP
jgi:hypothetical protein